MDNRQLVFQDFEVPDPGRIAKVVRFIEKNSDKKRSYKLLEFASCRSGLADNMTRYPNFECYGVDINPRKIDGVKIYHADVNEGIPKMAVDKFDFIFAGEFIEHLFDDEGFIEKCYNRLKPGGYLIITVPNLHYFPNRILVLLGKLPMFTYHPGHYHIYTKKIITAMVKRSGFDIKKVISSHVLFPARYNKIGALFEFLGDKLPKFGAHLIVFAQKPIKDTV